MARKPAKRATKRISKRKVVHPLATAHKPLAEHTKRVTVEDIYRIQDYLCRQDNGASPVKRASTTYINFMHEQERADTGNEVILDLAFECARVERGDMRRIENMLVTQIHSLDGIFHRLAQRAATCDDMETFEAFMRMGLRAQGQSRASIEALNEMKNPKSVAFFQQANIAQNQQVNNDSSGAPGQQSQFPPNKLKALTHEPAMDTRAPTATGGRDQVIEAVGTVDRTQDCRRKAARKP